MREPPDPQTRHAEALENHDHLTSSLRGEVDGIQRAASQSQRVLLEVSPVLNHTALSLRHLNPSATNTINALLSVVETLGKDLTQRTDRLQEWIRASG